MKVTLEQYEIFTVKQFLIECKEKSYREQHRKLHGDWSIGLKIVLMIDYKIKKPSLVIDRNCSDNLCCSDLICKYFEKTESLNIDNEIFSMSCLDENIIIEKIEKKLFKQILFKLVDGNLDKFNFKKKLEEFKQQIGNIYEELRGLEL